MGTSARMRHRWSLPVSILVTCAGAGWYLLALASPAHAQTGISLSVTPDTLSVVNGESAEVALVVRNDSAEAVGEVTIEAVKNANISLPSTTTIGSIPAGGAAHEIISVTIEDNGVVSGRVDFVATAETTPSSTMVLATTTLTIQERQPPEAKDLISSSIVTALSKLTDRGSADVFVQVKNVSNRTVDLKRLQGIVPEFLALCYVGSDEFADCAASGDSFTTGPLDHPLPPQGQASYRFRVTRQKDQVFQAGKQVMLFRIVTSTGTGDDAEVDQIVRHDFETIVFGESEILTPLGLGSFLLLPGFLLVVAIGALWRYSLPREELAYVDAKKPEFWILTISGSLLVVTLYRVLRHRNLLDGYDSTDLFTVWTGAIALGVALWIAILIVRKLIMWTREQRRTFAPRNKPWAVIFKLARRQDGSVARPKVTVRIGSESKHALLLAAGDSATDRSAVAPGIEYRFGSSVRDLVKSGFGLAVTTDDLRFIKKAIGRLRFWPYLRYRRKSRRVELSWGPGDFQGVRRFVKGQVNEENDQQAILSRGS
jgi:hypothetical protein